MTGLETSQDPAPTSVQHILSGDGTETVRTQVSCPHCQHSMSVDFATSQSPDRAPTHKWPATRPGTSATSVESGLNQLVATDTPIADIMSREVVCARVDMSVEALAHLLLTHNISGVPVVDEEGRPKGVVSKTDVMRFFTEEELSCHETVEELCLRTENGYELELEEGFHFEPLPRGTVGEIMMHFAFTLPPHTSISQAAALMAYEGIHRVVVVDPAGRVTGLVTTLDLARWLSQETGDAVPATLSHPLPTTKDAPRAVWTA
jgi:CBS domain-containing protein